MADEATRASTPDEHKATAPTTLGCWVLTISDTKTVESDTSGALIRERLAAAGHRVVGSGIVRDEPVDVQRIIRQAAADPAVQIIIMTGGTGVTSRDSTYEAVDAMLDKRLPGFGELFRMLSWEDVGSAAWLSRAAAGIAAGKLLVILPGSPAAVRLAVDRLLVPELAHAARLLGRLEREE